MSLKLFQFSVQNMRTKECTRFLGQGVTMEEALKDGVKNAAESHGSGHQRGSGTGVFVKCADGWVVQRTIGEFEGDEPADTSKFS